MEFIKNQFTLTLLISVDFDLARPHTLLIPEFFWQQQGHGRIYVGSLADSRWADKVLTVPKNLFNQQTSSESAVIAALPVLRPGVTINSKLITQLEFKDNQMTLTWGNL